MTKVCKMCKKTKNVEEFSVDHRVKSGYKARCKQCYRDAYKDNTRGVSNKIKKINPYFLTRGTISNQQFGWRA